MLVLTRRKEEKIVIGDDVTLVVRKISSQRVQIAIQAPATVRVVRRELAGDHPEPATAQRSA